MSEEVERAQILTDLICSAVSIWECIIALIWVKDETLCPKLSHFHEELGKQLQNIWENRNLWI